MSLGMKSRRFRAGMTSLRESSCVRNSLSTHWGPAVVTTLTISRSLVEFERELVAETIGICEGGSLGIGMVFLDRKTTRHWRSGWYRRAYLIRFILDSRVGSEGGEEVRACWLRAKSIFSWAWRSLGRRWGDRTSGDIDERRRSLDCMACNGYWGENVELRGVENEPEY